MAHRAAAAPRAVYRRQQQGQQDFVSEEARVRYDVVKSRPIVIEKGFDVHERRNTRDYIDTIVTHGWQTFCAKRTEFNSSIVHEFYANAVNAEGGRVRVRGKEIVFTATEINNFYGTTFAEGVVDQYPLALTETTKHQLAEVITINQVIMWKGQGERLFSSKCLNRAAKVWHIFESASVFPTTHISDFAREKAVLIFCIMTGRRIDVGRLINERLVAVAKNPGEWSLAFPCLITELCKEKEVPTRQSDEWKAVPKVHNITESTITKAIKVDDEEREPGEHAGGGGPQQNEWLNERLNRIDHNQLALKEDLELIGESLRRSHIRSDEIYHCYVENEKRAWEAMGIDPDLFTEKQHQYWNSRGYLLSSLGVPFDFPPSSADLGAPGEPMPPRPRRRRATFRPAEAGASQSGDPGAGSSGAGTSRARLAPDDDDDDMED